jgi:hypothetical protein
VKAVGPSLEPGELTQLTARAQVAGVPLAAASPPPPACRAIVVLTDRRLLVLRAGTLSRPTPRLRHAFGRGDLTLLRFKPGPVSTLDLAVGGGGQQLRLRFPRANRTVADELAARLDVQLV